MHPYKENIDNSLRSKAKKGDVIYIHENQYVSKMYWEEFAIITERYRTLNQFNRRYWNYFTRFKLITGPKQGHERSINSGNLKFEFCEYKNNEWDIKDMTTKKLTKRLKNLDNVSYEPTLSNDIYVIHMSKNRSDAMNTGLKGYLHLEYDTIREIFGKPKFGLSGDDKVEWEWIFSINGTKVTIYNYKDGPTYMRDKKIKPSKIYPWHIGGDTRSSVNMLKCYLSSINEDYGKACEHLKW